MPRSRCLSHDCESASLNIPTGSNMRWPRRTKRRSQEADESTLAYPYYVDSAGLRTLADSLGIDVPLARDTGVDRKVSVSARGVGGERVRHETAHSEGHIHLNRLAALLKQSATYGHVVDQLGFVPLVSDPSILSATIRHIESTSSAGEQADNLLQRLRTAYDSERARTVAAAKREELEQVAAQNQLVILRGRFETLASSSAAEESVRVRLTHLEESGVPYRVTGGTSPEEFASETAEMRMPDGIGIEAVLPAGDAFTPDGRERLLRGAPFYGRLIGHSVSFDAATGILTCSTYAVWGMTRPARLLPQIQPYDFLEQE
jgi:hypothetical protein